VKIPFAISLKRNGEGRDGKWDYYQAQTYA
jgi:hypothetical protein